MSPKLIEEAVARMSSINCFSPMEKRTLRSDISIINTKLQQDDFVPNDKNAIFVALENLKNTIHINEGNYIERS